MAKEKCWLCLRITPEEILKYSHQIWEDKRTARKMGLLLSKLINITYQKKPSFFCGKSMNRIIGGGLYVLGLLLDEYKTQRDVAKALSLKKLSNETTIRNGYKDWKKVLKRIPKEKLPKEVRGVLLTIEKDKPEEKKKQRKKKRKSLKNFKPWRLSKHQQAMKKHGLIDEYGRKVKKT